VGKWKAAGCTQLNKRYPALVRKIGDEGFMNPEKAGTGDYIAKICREIVSRYDVDGIHLDYIRYPENWKQTVSKSEGRNYITQIVRRIHSAVKQEKPWVKVSCSPLGKFDNLSRYDSRGWNAYNTVCQDAQGWLREGIMDELFPMLYFRGDNFYPFAINWQENSHGRIIAPGLGIWLLSRNENNWPLTDITREIEVSRQLGMGHCYFRSRFLTDNTKGLYDFVCDFDAYPAVVPPLTTNKSTRPTSPTTLNIERTTNGDNLSWSGATDNSDGDYLTYNVYASTNYPVDINDARNIIATRLMQQNLSVRRSANDTPLHYMVTAVNRYGIESISNSQQQTGKSQQPIADSQLIPVDNYCLQVADFNELPQSDNFAIYSTQGVHLMNKPFGPMVFIGDVEKGFYELRTFNNNGISHHVGFFLLK
jgi:hypothetical protein